MTPRKTRQRHNNSNTQSHPAAVQASDYESEAFYAPPVPTRSNTELNLSVLRRHHPSVQSILSIAPSTQLYIFSPEISNWERTEIEGTLFVCQLAPVSLAGTVQHCIIVMNRKGLDNLILNLSQVVTMEISDKFFLMLGVGDGEEMKMIGFHIHPDKIDTPKVNCRLIMEKWEEALRTGAGGEANVRLPKNEAAVGRRLSLTDLFR